MQLLLSIKPEYSNRIFSGEKRYEFRKQRPRRDIRQVIVYESHPTKRIVGTFKVKRIISGSPETIWNRCHKYSGIERVPFFKYCMNKRIIYAMEIENPKRLEEPFNPLIHDEDFTPPQSFHYVDHRLAFLQELTPLGPM